MSPYTYDALNRVTNRVEAAGTSPCSAGAFTYVALNTPITLPANTAYYRVSHEANAATNGTTVPARR